MKTQIDISKKSIPITPKSLKFWVEKYYPVFFKCI